MLFSLMSTDGGAVKPHASVGAREGRRVRSISVWKEEGDDWLENECPFHTMTSLVSPWAWLKHPDIWHVDKDAHGNVTRHKLFGVRVCICSSLY